MATTPAAPRPRRHVVTTRSRRIALAAALGFAAVIWVARGAWVPPLWVMKAHSSITKAMDAQRIPGLSVAVATGGRVRWSSAYGLADVENHVAARVDTVYRMASVSKPVTAVAVMQLGERGKLDLDAEIQTYVPAFPKKEWPVTPRLLLGHLSGVRSYKGDELQSVRHYARFADAMTVFRDDPLVCEPGAEHVYSTYGYNLLGVAVEAASGRRFGDYVRDNIFRPAGMSQCRPADLDVLIPHRARGYFKTPDGTLHNSRPADLSNKTPGAGLCGTAEDLARFAVALQAGRLVKPETLALMTTRQATSDHKPVPYGLGWNLTRRQGVEEVWHAGNQQEVATLLYMRPEKRVAVALMCNMELAHLLDLAREIADAASP